jgi:hypothetical protein
METAMYIRLLTILFLFTICGAAAITQPTRIYATPEPSAVKTLVDDVTGFAFDYPGKWRVSGSPHAESTIYSYTLISFVPDPNTGGEGRPPPNETHLDVGVFQDPADLDDVRIRTIREGVDVIQESWRLTPTIQAIWIHKYSPPTSELSGVETEMLFTEINGRGILMACFSNTTPCRTIMRSLRPYDLPAR